MGVYCFWSGSLFWGELGCFVFIFIVFVKNGESCFLFVLGCFRKNLGGVVWCILVLIWCYREWSEVDFVWYIKKFGFELGVMLYFFEFRYGSVIFYILRFFVFICLW